MNEYAVAPARGAEDESDGPAIAADDGPPLSIGLFSAGWPPDAYSNGVITYVAGLAEGLEALGHRVTILTPVAAPGDWGDRVCVLGRTYGRRVGSARTARDRSGQAES